MTTNKVKEILDDVFGVYYSEYMGQGDYTEDEAQEALDTALNALDEVEKYKRALVDIKEDLANMNVLYYSSVPLHVYLCVDKIEVLNIFNRHIKGVTG